MILPKVLNKSDPASKNYIYVGRPTKWGNPFIVGKDGNRIDVVEKFRKWICDQPNLINELDELKGRNLACWCVPLACHADILLDLANPKKKKRVK